LLKNFNYLIIIINLISVSQRGERERIAVERLDANWSFAARCIIWWQNFSEKR